jgi:HTH-type transcriptional regulator/antitoxin HigA
MSQNFEPAEVFAPGEYLRDELEARGWTQAQFARILGRPLQIVNEIINGKKRITEETALELAAALGTSAKVWLNLENSYRLHRAKRPNPAISRRARRASAA